MRCKEIHAMVRVAWKEAVGVAVRRAERQREERLPQREMCDDLPVRSERLFVRARRWFRVHW